MHTLKWRRKTQDPRTQEPKPWIRDPGLETQNQGPRMRDPRPKTRICFREEKTVVISDNFPPITCKYWNIKYGLKFKKTPIRHATYVNIKTFHWLIKTKSFKILAWALECCFSVSKHFVDTFFAADDTYLVNFSNRLLELLTLCKLEYFLKYCWFLNKNKEEYNL